MMEKQCAGGASEQVCPKSAAAGALAKESHKGGTVELLLEVSSNSADRSRHCRKTESDVPWSRLKGNLPWLCGLADGGVAAGELGVLQGREGGW